MKQEAILFVADIVLKKAPLKQAFSLHGYIGGHLLADFQDQIPEDLRPDINEVMIRGGGVVREFLLREDFFDVHNHSFPNDIMTKKGRQAQKLGAILNMWSGRKNKIYKNLLPDLDHESFKTVTGI